MTLLSFPIIQRVGPEVSKSLEDEGGATRKRPLFPFGAHSLTLHVAGDGVAATHVLPFHKTFSVGRARDADIVIDHEEVSRHHLRIHTGPPIRIEDLGSANGTCVGDRVLIANKPADVTVGEPLLLGSVALVFRWEGARAGAAPATTSAPDPAPPGRDAPEVIVASAAMRELHRLVDQVAPSWINVLLCGETGVGKEVLAEAIHARSPRAGKPFLRLNCGALSEALLESELFGHERGAFTGATHAKPGLLESAEGGTVLLDEVGELPATLQVKLLRVLEERRARRVGGLVTRPIDARFVAATNRDLEQEVTRGTFRQDLYFRLNGITLTVPPLRERPDEIDALADTFLACACLRDGRPRGLSITPEARARLRAHPWPGNVRELKNVMERAALLARGDAVTCEHLSLRAAAGPRREVATLRTIPPAPDEAAPLDRAPSSPDLEASSPPGAASLRGEIQALERQRIVDAMERCAGNQTQAARLLGMSRGTLLSRLSLYGLPRPRAARDPR